MPPESKTRPLQQGITAGVLAGGRGQRMGGQDKGLIPFRGKPLIEHLLDRLKPQVAHILINANRHHMTYQRYGFPVVSDPSDDFQGPLAGMASLLQHSEGEWLVTLPCDAPLLPTDYVRRLLTIQQATGADIVVAHDGEAVQPVHALMARHLLNDLQDYLRTGGRQVHAWQQRHAWATADFSDHPQAFLNLNHPQDLLRLDSLLPQ